MNAVPWPTVAVLLAFAVAVGALWQWGLRNNAITRAKRRRGDIMRRLWRVRNHDHRGQT